MNWRILACMTVSAGILSSPLLHAEEEVFLYANVKDWKIMVDPAMGNGCFAFAEYERGSILRLGIDDRDTTVYMVFGNEDWQSIEYQKKYDVEIQFGRQDEWKGNARGMSFDPPEDQPYLWVTVNATDAAVLFIEEFMEEKFVELFYNGESIDKLALKGSYAAGVKLLECQKSMREQDRDPFANPSKKKDPFAI